MDSWTSTSPDEWSEEIITPESTPLVDLPLIPPLRFAPLKFKCKDVSNRKPASESRDEKMNTPIRSLRLASRQGEVCLNVLEDCKRDVGGFVATRYPLVLGDANYLYGGDRRHSRKLHKKHEPKENHYLKVVEGSKVHLIQGELECMVPPLCPLSCPIECPQISPGDVELEVNRFSFLDYYFRQLTTGNAELSPAKGGISPLFKKRLSETRSLVDDDNKSQSTKSSSVSCTWYRSSGTAQLDFKSTRKANMAKEVLERHLLFGRCVSVHWRDPERIRYGQNGKGIVTLLVGNLDPRTSCEHLEDVLKEKLKPDNINICPPEDFVDTEAVATVKRLLQNYGTISSFSFRLVDNMSTKFRAYATFINQESAVDAVKFLHSKNIKAETGSLFFVRHTISVNFQIPLSILDFNRPGWKETHYEYWQDGYLQYKIYQPIDFDTKSVGLRLFGDTTEQVAESKKSAESFLNGTVIMAPYSPIWHKYFLKPGSIEHLQELQRIHGLYLRYDSTQSQLLIYGGSPYQRREIQHRLKERIEILRRRTRRIGLLPPFSTKQSNFRKTALFSS